MSNLTPRIGRQGAASLFFLVFGAAAIWLGRSMDIGTAGEMGVGYVPRMLAIGCVLIGVWLAFTAWRTRAERDAVAFAWKPALLVPALVAAFGILLPRFGLPLTILTVVVMAGALSGETFRWPLLALTALTLAAVSTLLFHTLLRLQVPLWPELFT